MTVKLELTTRQLDRVNSSLIRAQLTLRSALNDNLTLIDREECINYDYDLDELILRLGRLRLELPE